MEKLSIRERSRDELDPYLDDPELLAEDREERLTNDEIANWEEGFEEGYNSSEDLLKEKEEES
ncbi:MAG: hypothetical protein HYS32_01165 [Candidatus Woesearchaeota archaeon]|nr:MAG: hypothetical protein HYS32_01165 [Candidatus Woesearchaeota archaeon]